MSDRVRSGEPGGSATRRPGSDEAASKDQAASRGSTGSRPHPVGRQPAGRVGRPRLTKAERRAEARAAREAALQAAARRRRRQGWTAAIAAAVVVVALVLIGVRVLGGGKSDNTAGSQASASASAAASASASAAPTQSLPPGTDPALATKPTVTAGTGSVTSLKTTTLIQGTGAAVKSGQSVTVNYVGVTYADGKEFDASWDRAQPFTFTIGQGQVIPGWDQGLIGVKVGSRVQLDIPANLAYGDNPSGGSPAGALRFVVDVLGAK